MKMIQLYANFLAKQIQRVITTFMHMPNILSPGILSIQLFRSFCQYFNAIKCSENSKLKNSIIHSFLCKLNINFSTFSWQKGKKLNESKLWKYNCRFPFDESTLFGYFLEIAFSMYGAIAYMILNETPVFLLVGITLHHGAFFKRFEYSVLNMDKDENKLDVHRNLSEIVRFRVSIKK